MFKKICLSLILVFSFLVFVPSVFASTLYLSPGSTNISQGSTVSVSIGINTAGESVNGVSAYLSYPADKLEVASISYGGSFSIAAEGSYGGGGIRISRGSISGVVGNVNVATVGFRGKSRGTATVSFIGGSAAPRTSDSSDSLSLGASTGGTYKIAAGSSVTTTVTPSAAPTPKDSSAPVIKDIKVSLVSTTSAAISWTTDEKADSTVEYGLNADKYFLSMYDSSLKTEHSLKLEGPALTPGTFFHFRIKSKDASGNEAVSENKTFQLKGYTVSIKVFDQRSKPVQDTEVFLYTEPMKSRTSVKGEAVFTNVAPGRHLVVVKLSNNLDRTGEINVQDSPMTQSFLLGIDTGISTTFVIFVTIALTGLLAVIAVLIILFKKKAKSSATKLPEAQL